MIDIPEKFTVRGVRYAYDVGLNQYVKVTGRVRPHDADDAPRENDKRSRFPISDS